MAINVKKLAGILVEKTEGKTETECSTILKQFVKFLHEQNLLRYWRQIEVQIHSQWKKRYGVSSIKIVSAHPLSPSTKKLIESSAKGAAITQKVEPGLIGGAIVRVDDVRLDGSIAGSLQRIKIALMK